MKNITPRGFAFYLDLAAAVLLVFLALYIMLAFFAGYGERAAEIASRNALESTAAFAVDSLVKNSGFGCAEHNVAAGRIESNFLSRECLHSLEGKRVGKYLVGKVVVSGEKLFGTGKERCVSIKRFALVDGKKSLVEVAICEQ